MHLATTIAHAMHCAAAFGDARGTDLHDADVHFLWARIVAVWMSSSTMMRHRHEGRPSIVNARASECVIVAMMTE
jgi:hypothetical protein